MAIDWGTEFGGNSPQQAPGSVGNAVVASGSAQSGSKMAEPQSDPVKMLQYAKDAGIRNVESMGQIGSSWFDGIPQVYDDDQIAAAKSAISRAQTPEGVQQIIQGLAGQNKGGNVGPINNALGQMGVGYSSDAGLSDIGRGIRSMTGTLDPVDVSAEDDYERVLQWLGNAIPNVAAISDLAIPLPSGAASTVHLYKGAKALPGKVVGGVKAAPGKAADWYKGRYNAYSDRLAGKKPAASAAPAAERTTASETAAPAAERTAASETAAPAAERTAAPAPRQEPAPQQPAPAPRQEPAPQQPAPAPRQAPAPQQPAPTPRQEPAPQQPAPAPRQEPTPQQPAPTPERTAPQQPAPAPRQEPAPQQPAPAAERTAASETAADGGVSELANAGNAGREAAAADGGVSELANAGAAGRAPKTGAGEATGSVSEGVNSVSQQLIEHIKSGTLDEQERARIAAIADTVRVPGTIDASTQAILDAARFAGLIP